MLQILKYIINNNNVLNIPKYLALAFFFQVFKRISNSIISKKIFNGKSLFMYPNCNVSSMYAYTDIPDRKEIMILRELIDNNGGETVFLDIGANIGSYSVSLMDLCSEHSSI